MSEQPWFRHWGKESLASADLLSLSDHEFRVWWTLMELASVQPERWTVRVPLVVIARASASTGPKVQAALGAFQQRAMVAINDGFSCIRILNWEKYQDSPDAARKRRERASRGGHVTAHVTDASADKSRTRPRTNHGRVPATRVSPLSSSSIPVGDPSSSKAVTDLLKEGDRKSEGVPRGRDETGQVQDMAEPDETPTAIREGRDMQLLNLPRKFQADPIIFDEAVLVAIDFTTEQIAEGQAAVRRAGGIPFPQKIRAAIEQSLAPAPDSFEDRKRRYLG